MRLTTWLAALTPYSPLIQPTATGREAVGTAREIWLDAYKKLEEDEGTKKMVEAYETILSQQLDGKFGSISHGEKSSEATG